MVCPRDTVTGSCQVRPPSVERLVRTALGAPAGFENNPKARLEIIQTSCSGS